MDNRKESCTLPGRKSTAMANPSSVVLKERVFILLYKIML